WSHSRRTNHFLGQWVLAFARTTVPEASARCRAELHAALGAAYELARARAGGLAVAPRHRTGHDGRVITIDLLQQAAAANGQVVMHLRRMQMQLVVVDHVDVGLVAGRDQAAVV